MKDLQFALRMVATHRWFSFAVILTLAVGIGINTTVFTLVNAVLFKPLPFPDGDRIAILVSTNTSQSVPRMNVSYPDFIDFQAQTRSFEQLGAISNQPTVISEAGHPPERFRMSRVSSNVFQAIRAEPIKGRRFGPADEQPGAPAVALIGYNVWRNRYSEAKDIVGKVVRLDETSTTIIGVMPPGFGFPNREEVWKPLIPTDSDRTNRSNRFVLVVALIKKGVPHSAAEADAKTVASRLEDTYPDTNKGINARVISFNERFNGGQVGTVFTLMLGAVGLVLLIACANVANMMLSRSLARRREMSVRSALGASRWRLIRLLLVESLVLSGAGGLLALLVAFFGVPAFDRAVANAGKPTWIIFALDYSVLGYLAVICVGSALVFGLAPALRSSRVDLNDALKEGGRGGSGRVGWLAGTLVVLQFAFAVVLLAAAGLLMRSFIAAQHVNAWLPQTEIMTGRVELPNARYADDAARIRFFDAAMTRLAQVPGVKAVGAASGLPGQGSGTRHIELEGALVANPPDRITVPWVIVSPTYFAIVDLAIVRGRTFAPTEGDTGRESVVVTRTFASRYWPSQEAVGKRLRFNDDQSPQPWMTVVGVTDEVVQSQQQAVPDAAVFVPYRQVGPSSLMLTLRTPGDASTLANPLREAVQAMDVDLPLFDVDTFAARLLSQRWPYRVFGTVFAIFALAALLIAAVGLYAVMSQSTGRRTREIGIRMALGATPGRILGAVMRAGTIQLGLGLVIGIGAALAVTGQMQTLLIGVVPSDPTTLVSTSMVLLTVGLLACWIPARRAALISPVRALDE